MNVWCLIPSANPDAAAQALGEWHAHGYFTALLLDEGADPPRGTCYDLLMTEQQWRGYPTAINRMFADVLHLTDAKVCVAAGDDLSPDPRFSAWELGEQFERQFPDLFGVMQPTGDAFGKTGEAAVSPWIGRTYAETVNGGAGPYWPEYWHLHSDEEVAEVARLQGAYWERPDVKQFHAHWSRNCRDNLTPTQRGVIVQHQEADRKLFHRRKCEGFPGACVRQPA